MLLKLVWGNDTLDPGHPAAVEESGDWGEAADQQPLNLLITFLLLFLFPFHLHSSVHRPHSGGKIPFVASLTIFYEEVAFVKCIVFFLFFLPILWRYM